MSRDELFIGVDTGGSKTTATCIDAAGCVRGAGHAGGASLATASDDEIRDAIAAAVREASAGVQRSDIRAACVGAAGYSVASRRELLVAAVEQAAGTRNVRIEPDYCVAWFGATRGAAGIVAIAGTGAVTYGRNDAGDEAREDGLGFLLGDRGSGYDLGIRVLRHAIDQLEERDADLLTSLVCEYTGVSTSHELVHWLYELISPARVAALAPVAGVAADQGDPAARILVDETASRLRFSVREVRLQLALPASAPVFTLGGLWSISPRLRARFAAPDSVGSIDDHPFVVADPAGSPALGAAWLAQQCAAVA